MRSRIIAVLAVLTGLVGLLIGSYFWYWHDSPRWALLQMVKAIQGNDVDTLFQYIDLQSIADNLAVHSTEEFDQWLSGTEGSNNREDDISRLARGLSKRMARILTPKFVGALEPLIKTQTQHYISGLNTLEKASLTTIVGAAEINRQGDVAEVILTDPKDNRPFRFRLARKPDRDGWKIVEVDYQNLRDLIRRKF
ncbi:DUF2939 domain-containing protein [Desulfobacca acetoxidans]|uniref:DUF2939 domain-containing protein n=1 Tax=Desulfobacca acetoxidans (strain ATCC 700848 / DSM 11109 / ASRB2) TaxID=880072 RepID=F2NI56_DESAR|nr:DUF2939 domain-containing protein [Desulfobacca acetoxidans]AEB09825.1 hypothetical protein Desac_1994 [Desulfobacca acetoxidans DSM 11109]